jgi:hypothetical protein
VPEVLADRDAEAHAEDGVDRLDAVAGAEEAALVEQPVVGQERLARDAAQRAAFEQGGGDEQPVVVRLLDEAHHHRHRAGVGRQPGQPRIVGAHGHFGVELLQQVAGQAEFGERQQVDALGACLPDQFSVADKVRLSLPELGRDLGQPDAQGRHGPESSRSKQAVACLHLSASLRQSSEESPARVRRRRGVVWNPDWQCAGRSAQPVGSHLGNRISRGGTDG